MEQSLYESVGHIGESLINRALAKPLAFILVDHKSRVFDGVHKHIPITEPVDFGFALPGPLRVCPKPGDRDDTAICLSNSLTSWNIDILD